MEGTAGREARPSVRRTAIGSYRSKRMRSSPSIVLADRLDRDIYLVLEDFGARTGCAWRETDEQDTDRETVLRDIISGQYAYPLRIVAFNAIEGWSRDATEDVTDALADRADRRCDCGDAGGPCPVL
jgi:hypothetical protein